ncbi:MAG: [FeFe] hydrogenase H-cluster radical SAM maturase HydG [Syntrophales bacterium]|nr:[FeFe] hydrogenase H-cluster radical SAM maturase HydG [Syntrophales bacterium]
MMNANLACASLEKNWIEGVVKKDEITRYLIDGKDFINDEKIWDRIIGNENPDPGRIRDIIRKSLTVETLDPDETAALLNVQDEDLWREIFEAAGEVKRRVYDNRIVTFAPLYFGNLCVNDCLYCAFRKDNGTEVRKRLSLDQVREETKAMISMGHKRLMLDCGEHPGTDADYIADVLRTIYETKIGRGEIRRININVASMSIEKLRMLNEVGIGTYQVFQETYHHKTYRDVHPNPEAPKSNYGWRLYSQHRAMDAGIDDVGIGVLFGLYDWRFEVMGLLYHALNLEEQFGVGPHTISIPRLQPAEGTPFIGSTGYRVCDDDFKKLVAIIRLSVPYTGLILTARESAQLRREVIPLGITQADAGTRIGIGAYGERYDEQEAKRQQFLLGDPRGLDEFIRELAERGYITSFCTAGYRCGRTGEHIMQLLKCGQEGRFCKLNAVLTFREWLDDFASEQTKQAGERIIQKELDEISREMPSVYPKLTEYYKRIEDGERDLFF